MVEVGPRDGLQNEAQIVPAATKVALIERLAAAGLPVVEAGSFVSPKWIPQMADTAEVLARMRRREGVSYPVLVPNMKGFDAARAAGVEEIAIFGAASEKFSQRNINCSIAESLERFAPVTAAARQHGMRVRGYISCVVDCPYEGPIAPDAVADVAAKLVALGCYEISLGDTIGTGTPARIQAMIERVAAAVPRERLAVHFHDTYGQALANILASLELGVATIDSSVAGLGGCPYAKGASGNVASEDVLYLLNGLGIRTGVDLAQLAAAGQFISTVLGREPASKVARALAAKAA
jgi:isopropylmalate/homocitrate/citramalate synthase